MSWRRGSTVPMEFEYDNQRGPVDQNSPFLSGVNNNHPGKKRPHSVLDSPAKSGFATPNRPQLREPNSQHWLFSQPDGKPLPAVPSHVQDPKLWEPRTPVSIADFSSGGETPNTPTLNEDSEATPDTGLRGKMSRMMSNDSGKESPKKRRESWLSKMFSSSPSPAKGGSRQHYSHKAENRVMKRRSKNRGLIRREEYESDDEGSKSRRGKKKSSKQDGTSVPPDQQPGMVANLGSFFSYIESHPYLPSILSFYLQLLLNCFLVFGAIYILYCFWHSVTDEVNIQAQKKMVEIMAEIATCAKNYRENKCDPKMRIPAMENLCSNWESCMQRDPKKVARASVTAKTFAMIFNSFVEEFSYKSMIFTGIVIFGGFNISNWAFGLFRSKHSPHHHDSFSYPPPPATPQRFPSNGFIDQQGYFTPYGSMNANMIAQASQGMPALPIEEAGEENRSPAKKLLFR
ncbi:hypothetical protein K469DRAFT_719972 [Zopfia rhizophila CBS 207.26]|uniref:Brl1/Brr6 domain-containing protein n=1 Tax=Zopfia rhizophila CBS 207.26 TaxID=1314779 RepID=A0A6A6ELN1_9PEZI|nr:hypothetical protein K469DRAFT_719972 [Zopfia rhizophila CBS 207.26]